MDWRRPCLVLLSCHCQASRVAVDRALSERVKGDEAQNWFRTECERDRGREGGQHFGRKGKHDDGYVLSEVVAPLPPSLAGQNRERLARPHAFKKGLLAACVSASLLCPSLCGLSDALGRGNYFHSFLTLLVCSLRVNDPRQRPPSLNNLFYPFSVAYHHHFYLDPNFAPSNITWSE